jgi:hypothetical protein
MPVNVQSATLAGTGSGTLTLTGSPTGSGIYTVAKNAGATAPQVIGTISGGSGYAMITIKPAVASAIRVNHNGTSFFLQAQLDWLPDTVNDRITLRDRDGNGTVWVEEVPRASF